MRLFLFIELIINILRLDLLKLLRHYFHFLLQMLVQVVAFNKLPLQERILTLIMIYFILKAFCIFKYSLKMLANLFIISFQRQTPFPQHINRSLKITLVVLLLILPLSVTCIRRLQLIISLPQSLHPLSVASYFALLLLIYLLETLILTQQLCILFNTVSQLILQVFVLFLPLNSLIL